MIIQGSLLLFVFVFLFAISYNNTRDLFSPICFFAFFSILRYVPYMTVGTYEKLTFQNLNLNNTFYTFINITISTVCIVMGYLLYKTMINRKGIIFEKYDFIQKEYKKSHIAILYLIGIFARIRIIFFASGIKNIFFNRAAAYSSLDNGTGYLFLLANCVIIACMLQLSNCIKAFQEKNKQIFLKKMIILLIMTILYILSIVIFTSRSPILELIMFLAFGVNYLYKKINIRKLLNPKSMMIIIFILCIVILLPRIRVSSYGETQGSEGFFWELSDQFTLVGRDTFVYNYFGTHDHWYGKSYLGLLTSFIPSSIYTNKPPVDDGCYLSNMIYGWPINPPMPGNELTVKYSIPFSTSGLAFANFGVFGIVFINILLGFLYGVFYFSMRYSKNVKKIILYELIIYQLEITTLSIVQTLMPALICLLYFRYIANEK